MGITPWNGSLSLPGLIVEAQGVRGRSRADVMPASYVAGTRLGPWIAKAASSKLAAFVARVYADKDAVAAAISTPWSSGQVKGAICRLKSIKRQMYGGAKLDWLKARIMAPV